MFVVIPTRVQPVNACLPHALTSIERYTDLTPVTVGHDTSLVERHIPTAQGPDAFANTRLALEAALGTDWIGDKFIWSHDDIYWLRPAQPIRRPIGNLEYPSPMIHPTYRRRKAYTAAWLRAHDLSTLDYEAHTPMLIDVASMRGLLPRIPDTVDWRSAYLNTINQPDPMGMDVKLRNLSDRPMDQNWASTVGDPMKYRHLAPVIR